MQCKEAHDLLGRSRYQASGLDAQHLAGLESHLESCAACQAYAAEFRDLDALLAEDIDEQPGPGFDTRFFAHLEEVKHESSPKRWHWLRWATAGFATAAAAALLVFVSTETSPTLDDDLALAMHLDLMQDFDVAQRLDDIEAFELLAQLDAETLERLAGEGDLP